MNSHTLFQARDISVQIEKGADANVLSLLHETVWGTPGGIRYQKITSTESEEYFKDSWFLKLWKGDQLLGVAGMVHRRYLIEGFPLNTFYLRSFSFHPKYQVQLNPNTKNKKTKANNLLLKSIQPRHIVPRDEQVDVMRPFISQHRFQVHHVAHNGVFIRDTHTAVYLARFAGNFECHMHIVAFGHRNLRRSHGTGIRQGAKAPGQELGFGDLRDHFGQFLLR